MGVSHPSFSENASGRVYEVNVSRTVDTVVAREWE